jgi:hypothetical protein
VGNGFCNDHKAHVIITTTSAFYYLAS